MVTGSKKRKSSGSKRRFIGKATGEIQERVQAAGPEHFGIVAVDCAKRRSKWMLCNFYGKVIIERPSVEHTAGGLRVMTPFFRPPFSAPAYLNPRADRNTTVPFVSDSAFLLS